MCGAREVIPIEDTIPTLLVFDKYSETVDGCPVEGAVVVIIGVICLLGFVWDNGDGGLLWGRACLLEKLFGATQRVLLGHLPSGLIFPSSG